MGHKQLAMEKDYTHIKKVELKIFLPAMFP